MVLQRVLSRSKSRRTANSLIRPGLTAAGLFALVGLSAETIQAQEYAPEAIRCYSAVNTGDAKKFVKPCQAAIAKGDSHAMFLMATVTRDAKRQQELLGMAVQRNHLRAHAALADLLRRQGKTTQARELDRKAASLGHGPSRIRLASIMRRSKDAKQKAEARRMFQKDAQAGYPVAQFQLAVMLSNGEGGPANNNGALRWLGEAASAGHRRAQYELGMALIGSQPAMAASWLLKAARAGSTPAMVSLARLNAQGGKNVQQNFNQAFYWSHLAIRNGNTEAVKMLQRIRAASANAQRANAQAAKTNAAAKKVDLKKIQEHLNTLGYKAGVPDGVMGGNTRRAISQFEKDNSLPETGKPSHALLQRLEKAVKAN